MKIVESTVIKKMLYSYCLAEKGHAAVVTEGLNNGDVVSITKSMFCLEFEIKVSRSDLKKELDCIEWVAREKAGEPINSEQMMLLGKNARDKSHKHRQYSDPKKWLEKKRNPMNFGMWEELPNYFYFVVTENLVDYCLERLEGNTSFGVLTIGCRNKRNPAYAHWHKECTDRCYDEIVCVKKPRRLHSEPVSNRVIISTLTRMSWENKSMLEELVACKAIVNERHSNANFSPRS